MELSERPRVNQIVFALDDPRFSILVDRENVELEDVGAELPRRANHTDPQQRLGMLLDESLKAALARKRSTFYRARTGVETEHCFRCFHRQLVGLTVSVHQRPLTFAPAADWCNVC